MTLLITGGFGYLGGRLAQFLAKQSTHEIVLGSRMTSEPPVWLPNARVVKTDWAESAELEKICAGVNSVVHLAGMNAQDSLAQPVEALEFNGLATARLLHAAIRQGVERFVYVSTIHVYKSPLTGVITEETCPRSLHPYATSHRAGEDVLRAAHARGEIQGIVIRLSNAYGVPAHKDVGCWQLLVNDLCRQALDSHRMVLHSNVEQRRDFIALTRLCRAIHHLLEVPEDRLGNGVFNVGGDWSPTIMEMAERIAERVHAVTGRKPEIMHESKQLGQAQSVLDFRITKLLKSGFAAGPDIIDQELDALIRFCIGST